MDTRNVTIEHFLAHVPLAFAHGRDANGERWLFELVDRDCGDRKIMSDPASTFLRDRHTADID